MRRRYLDLAIASGLAMVTVIVAWMGPKNLDQINSLPLAFAPLGILMTLFIPGYVIAIGLFPRFDGPGVLILSLGLSIVVDVFSGFVLNYLSWGLEPLSLAIFLAIITWTASLNAAFGRPRLLVEGSAATEISSPVLTWQAVLAFIIAASILIAAIGITIINSSLVQNNFTQLWALPENKNGFYAIKIGINNYEDREVHYNLYVEERGVKIMEQPDVVVTKNQKWVTSVDLSRHPESLVRIYLYLTESPKEIYRTVQIAPVAFDTVITPTPTSINQ